MPIGPGHVADAAQQTPEPCPHSSQTSPRLTAETEAEHLEQHARVICKTSCTKNIGLALQTYLCMDLTSSTVLPVSCRPLAASLLSTRPMAKISPPMLALAQSPRLQNAASSFVGISTDHQRSTMAMANQASTTAGVMARRSLMSWKSGIKIPGLAPSYPSRFSKVAKPTERSKAAMTTRKAMITMAATSQRAPASTLAGAVATQKVQARSNTRMTVGAMMTATPTRTATATPATKIIHNPGTKGDKAATTAKKLVLGVAEGGEGSRRMTARDMRAMIIQGASSMTRLTRATTKRRPHHARGCKQEEPTWQAQTPRDAGSMLCLTDR